MSSQALVLQESFPLIYCEAWQTIKMLQAFHRLSDIQLFKPTVGHASRSSFYMFALNVEPDHPEALTAKEVSRHTWQGATFVSATF
jgi:hypothetical protein